MATAHQILSGAVNPGDRSFSLGNIDGNSFLAYASGCNLVILSFDFQRVQILPGTAHIQISCVHCSPESGKIAAAYQNKIKIFEPFLIADEPHSEENPLLNYRWKESSVLECECRVNSLSWDGEGRGLLMGGTSLQLWKISVESDNWECVWKVGIATEVQFLSFSPDSSLFATAGKFDRLVKIWYPITRFSPTPDKVTYGFVYLAHPRAVTGFSWRQTSKYMPKGAVFNAIITSCLDKICRVWTETVIPEDGFSLSLSRDLQTADPKFQRTHKHRIAKRLQHVKACFHLKKHGREHGKEGLISSVLPLPLVGVGGLPGLPGGPATNIPHLDYSGSHILNHGVSVHFHLAGSINAESDIPLVPPLKHHNFRLFWLNNKEMYFTHQAEIILGEMCRRAAERGETPDDHSQTQDGECEGSEASSGQSSGGSNLSESDGNEGLDKKLEGLLREWHRSPDLLVSLHPIDGSLLVWHLEWLDEWSPGKFRQAVVSFDSCIPQAIPVADASSMSSQHLFLFPLEPLASNRAAMMTKHHNGSLNLWTLSFTEDSKFSQVLNVAHAKRASGHRFKVREMVCHPVLPLVLTAASQSGPEGPEGNPYSSELILWRVDPIGPLCRAGGAVEVARMHSAVQGAFSHVAWVPGLLPASTLFSSSAAFVASDGEALRVYQAVLDATNLLAEVSTLSRKRKASLNDSVVSLSSSSSMSSLHGETGDEGFLPSEPDLFAIVSQQSTSRPGCILQLERIDRFEVQEVSFIQVYREEGDGSGRGSSDYKESFHVVVVSEEHVVRVWRLEVWTSGVVIGEEEEPLPPKPSSFLRMKSEKILEESLPTGANAKFSSCGGHLVCGSTAALLATTPTAVYLWKLRKNENDSFAFQLWNTLSIPIPIEGKLLQASAAYSGRVSTAVSIDENLIVGIWECESSGGTSWAQEDSITLPVSSSMDHVHLEFVPRHDAEQILALALADTLRLFAHVAAVESSNSIRAWRPLHIFNLSSADGLTPLPVTFGFVHAVCLVAMRNEMQVYSQWDLDSLNEVRGALTKSSSTGKEEGLRSLASGGAGIFEQTRRLFPVLPQYHPGQLMEMLNSGKVRWVRLILAHLVRCMGGPGVKRANSFSSTGDADEVRGRSRSRGLSFAVATPPSPLEHRNSIVVAPEELASSFGGRSIPPLPLWMLLSADQETRQVISEDKSRDYNELFSGESIDDPLDETVFDDIGDEEEGGGGGRSRRRSTSVGDSQPLTFGVRQARVLSRVLTHTQLPGMTSLDQMHLLALADTVASIGTRLDQAHAEPVNKALHDGTPDSLDECGLKFLIVVKQYSYLVRCLPPGQRASLQKVGVESSDVVWAFHSECQEDLLTLIPPYQKGEVTWSQLRELGLGFWLRSYTSIRTVAEKLGKSAYQKDTDPMDAALFYLAMKKKSLLWGLYRSKRDDKMVAFFSNDFSQERWRKAALKNAYALLGKQRFEHAAAFFLLAGSLKDALEVCMSKLNDLQLALVIGRLYEGTDLEPTPPSVKQLLMDGVVNSPTDPFLRSMGLWMLKDYQGALDTLLGLRNAGTTRVFNFYIYLRNHPLLVRARATSALPSGLNEEEGKLYFLTAHAHYSAGCPALAIHVLSLLPKITLRPPPSPSSKMEVKKIESGIFENDSHFNYEKCKSPKSPKIVEKADAFDWSAPVKADDDELKLDWGDENDNNEEDEEESEKVERSVEMMGGLTLHKDSSIIIEDEDRGNPAVVISEEMRLGCCLKLLTEELVSMAGQVEGTELRLHLYAWLEKQVPTLRELCNYKGDEEPETDPEWERDRSQSPRIEVGGLTEVILSEKEDLEWKMSVLSRRSRWLRSHRHLLATLLAFGRLHAHAIPAVHIELVFLFDELTRERRGPALLSPLPLLNSEFPLLSAVANPGKGSVAYLLASARDILATVARFPSPPAVNESESEDTSTDWRVILVLKDSAFSLSSCLFQALSDSEGGSGTEVALSTLYTPRRRRWSSSGASGESGSTVISTPDKWPGVSLLRGMLSREEDGDSPRLKFLLVEAYAAAFSALFVHAVATCDAKGLYRLLGKKMDATGFASIFGGGSKRQIKISTYSHLLQTPNQRDTDGGDTSPSSVWTTLASLNKARMKFNMKLLGQQFTITNNNTSPRDKPMSTATAPGKEDRPSYREKFVPPEIPILAYLMSKPKSRTDEADGKLIFLDTDDEEEDLEDENEEEDDDDFWGTTREKDVVNKEEEPHSYSWRLMRLAAVKLAKLELQRIVTIAGIDTTELSQMSPYLDGVIRVFSSWQDRGFRDMETMAPPPSNFLRNSAIENVPGPPIHKYRALLNPSNTPFLQKGVTFPLRRIWNFLVREDGVQEMFVRFVFGKRRDENMWDTVSMMSRHAQDSEDGIGGDEEPSPIGPVRIVHKEHESITSFCVNQANPALLAISTPKEIQELNVGVLLDMESWKLEDQYEFDLLNLYKDPEGQSGSSYLVVESPSDRSVVSGLEKPQKGSHSLIKGVNFPGCTHPPFVQYVLERSKRFLVPILKHRVDGIRRMASHSSRSLYLSGSQDGSVRLWEFSHAQPVSIPRPPGTFAKVTRIRFNGSKFGVADGDGRLSLWQIGANPRPFYTMQCHNKQTSDFVFLGSQSLLASGGTSSDSKNVAMWDTLMPMRKSQIASFTCHEQGCVALVYAEEHQCLISAGKKGAICIWDVRQRSLRHRFQGHEAAIKCMCLDPGEEFFITGSADGDMKVWDFSGRQRAVYAGEHSRSGFFKNIPGQGVTQISVDASRRLFSCGADGSVKIRILPDKFE